MKIPNKILLIAMLVMAGNLNAGQPAAENPLSPQQQSLIAIAALTAKGDLDKLKPALNTGLATGLTVSEIREALVHVYAYCGFPRSIRGLQTFMQVLDERKAKGMADAVGKDASPIDGRESKYERGKKILEQLTQTPQPQILTGYSAFAPAMDTFLKEHLFADIFERDVLTHAQRELLTISVIAAIGKAEPMLRSHLNICLNLGLTPDGLRAFVSTIRSTVGKKAARSAAKTLDEVLEKRNG